MILLLATLWPASAAPPAAEIGARILQASLATGSGSYAGEGYAGQLDLTVTDTRFAREGGAWRIEIDVVATAAGAATIAPFGHAMSCAATVAPTPITVSALVVARQEGRPARVLAVDADLGALTAARVAACLDVDAVDSALIALLHNRLEPHREPLRQSLERRLRHALEVRDENRGGATPG